jgi:hypothetical protein
MAVKNMQFHGEAASSNAAAGVSFLIYQDKHTDAYTLNELPEDTKYWEYLSITDVVISAASAGEVALFADTNSTPSTVGAGEVIVRALVSAQEPLVLRFDTPISLPAGSRLTLIAPAGQVYAQVRGYIRANP